MGLGLDSCVSPKAVSERLGPVFEPDDFVLCALEWLAYYSLNGPLTASNLRRARSHRSNALLCQDNA